MRILFVILSFSSGLLLWSRWARFDPLTSFLLTPLSTVVLVIIIGTPLYWLYRFDLVALSAIITILFGISIIATIKPLPIKKVLYLPLRTLVYTANPFKNQILSRHLFAFLYLALGIILVLLLFHGRTLDSALGPWERLPTVFFIVYTGASLILLLIGYMQKSYTTLLLVIHACITLSILGIVFPLGYGFDPFLHRAAEHTILQSGFIAPKTLYYIGQYVTVVGLTRFLSIPLFSVDVWLVPLLATLSIIPLSTIVVREYYKNSPWNMLIAMIMFVVPYPSLINTTPWSLAFLLFIVTVLLNLLYFKKPSPALMGIIGATTLSALFVHPLAGIPSLIISGITLVQYIIVPIFSSQRVKTLIRTISCVGASLLIPSAFIFNGILSRQLTIHLTIPHSLVSLTTSIGSLFFSYTSHFNVWQDLAYFFPSILGFALLGVGIGVTIYCRRNNSAYNTSLTTIWLWWIALIGNVLLIKYCIQFDSLISYEQAIFSQRLYEASMITLLPFGAVVLHVFLRRLLRNHGYPIIKLTSFVFIAGLMTGSLYVSYPKQDAYNAYHGYMVSAADIATVRWIENNAGAENHIVLASQVVAAAAIQEFGFKQYFRREIDGRLQDIFYYPTPTSSPLYIDYRDLLVHPTQERIDSVMDTYDIEKLYIVINHYEPQYEGKKNTLRSLSDHEEVIHVGKSEDTVFVFKKH